MLVKFYRDVIPVSDLKINPGKTFSRTHDTHLPILLTSFGRSIAVVQGLEDYEQTTEELRFIKAVAQGLIDTLEGNTLSLEDAKKALGIK